MEYEIKIKTNSPNGRSIVSDAAGRLASAFGRGDGYTAIVLSEIRPFPAISDVMAAYEVYEVTPGNN